MIKILIIDDDANIIKSLELTLESRDYEILSTTDPNQGIALLNEKPEVVILDVYLEGQDGRDILLRIREINPRLPVIMISGLASLDEALECVRLGAFDFIQKPLHPNRLMVSLENALKLQTITSRVVEEILPVQSSPKMKELVSIAEKVAPTDSPVLITGESGTGKDLVARLIHSLSRVSKERMVKINCGAIPENLIESELFGHKKGSFTGADKDYEGKIQYAQGGTLFLDELGELPLAAQVKLLRFLENREIQRIGEQAPRYVEARIIGATNRDLAKQVEQGLFREDLFYRLNVIELHLPSLKEREEEIHDLIEYFSLKYCAEHNVDYLPFTPEAMKRVASMELKGNIRELRNIVERSIILNSHRKQIHAEHIMTGSSRDSSTQRNPFLKTEALQSAKKRLERTYIEEQLKKHGFSIKKTAQALDQLPTNLSRRMKLLGIEIPREGF